MGEKKRKLVQAIINNVARHHYKRLFDMDDEQVTAFANRHRKKITFEKIKRFK